MNPYQENIDKLICKLKKAEAESTKLREQFLATRDLNTLFMHLQVIDRYLGKARKYNYWFYYQEQWKKHFTAKQMPISLNSILCVEHIGYHPLEALLNKTGKNLEKSNPWDVMPLNAKIDQAKQNLERIEKRKYFKSKELISQFAKEIALLMRERAEILENEQVTRLRLAESRKVLRDYIDQWKRVENIYWRIKEIRKQIERESPYEQAHELAYAKAAAVDQRTRSLAGQKKNYVEKTMVCPYCNLPLLENAHLDHIQPVKRGGLSIKENLVWCCSKCNLAKSDKGLIEFLSTANLDIERVCQTLIRIGKKV